MDAIRLHPRRLLRGVLRHMHAHIPIAGMPEGGCWLGRAQIAAYFYYVLHVFWCRYSEHGADVDTRHRTDHPTSDDVHHARHAVLHFSSPHHQYHLTDVQH